MRGVIGRFAVLVSCAMLVGSSSVSGAATLTAKQLSNELLNAKQVPSGWRVSSDLGANGVGCLKNLLEQPSVVQKSEARVFYLGQGDLPAFDEKIATYANTTKAYGAIIKQIDACRHVSGLSVTGHLVTGSVAPMSFTHYGNASAAFSMNLTDAGIDLKYDYVIARKGRVVVAVLEANMPSVNVTQFKSLTKAAVAKVS